MQSSAANEPDELSYCAWFGFWVPLVLLGFVVVIGVAYASAGGAPGDEVCGLILSVAAVGLTFMLIKRRFDGDSLDWAGFLFVDDMSNLILAIVVFVVLALLGLIAAARVDYGGLHDSGIALVIVSAFGIFFSLKHVFDSLDRSH